MRVTIFHYLVNLRKIFSDVYLFGRISSGITPSFAKSMISDRNLRLPALDLPFVIHGTATLLIQIRKSIEFAEWIIGK